MEWPFRSLKLLFSCFESRRARTAFKAVSLGFMVKKVMLG